MHQNIVIKKILSYGILAGIAICTKQSIGVTLAIVTVGYKLLFVENKEQFKRYLKIAINRIIGILIPLIILFLYLIISGAFRDFINYAILGISTFSNKIPYLDLLNNKKIEIKILSILMPISIILMIIILLITKKNIISILLLGKQRLFGKTSLRRRTLHYQMNRLFKNFQKKERPLPMRFMEIS